MTKTNLVKWSSPAGAIHSLPHLAELSDEPCRLLCLSDRSLYVLQNLAAVEVQFIARYARDLTKDGFWPVRKGDPEYSLYLDVTDNLKEEVIDMSCNIQAGLEDVGDGLQAIAASLGTISVGGGCGADLANPIAGPISNIDNDTMLGPPDWQLGDPETDPPPDGFTTWGEYLVYKCQAAHFIWHLIRSVMVALQTLDGMWLTANLIAPVVAGATGALPAAFTPAGFAVFVGAILACGILAGFTWFYIAEMLTWWNDNKYEIICSLYTSGTSVQAVSALANALEDAIQAIVSWGLLAPVAGQISAFLGQAFGVLAGNGLVEPLFKLVAAVSAVGEYDCSECEGAEGYGYETWGIKGGSTGTGHCFKKTAGTSHSNMEGRDDGALTTFVYNRVGTPCNAYDFRFKLGVDFGQVFTGGERQVWIKAKKTSGSLFCISRTCRYATSQEQWDTFVATGNDQALPQAGGSVKEFLNIGSELAWVLLFTLPAEQQPINARWLVFATDVPGPDGWTEGATWEVDAIRIEVV